MLRAALLMLVVLCFAAPTFAAPTVLDVIPDDAQAALFVRNVKELKKKGDDLIKETELDLGIRPTDAVQWFYDQLGLKTGIDEERPTGIVLVKSPEAESQRLVVVAPFADRGKMAANFDLKADDLAEGKIVKIKARINEIAFACARGDYVLLGSKEEVLRGLLKSKPLVHPAARVRALAESDILFYASPTGSWNDDWKAFLKEQELRADQALREVDPEIRKQLFETLAVLQSVFITVRVEDGVNLRLLTLFPKEQPAGVRKFLGRLHGGGAADLAGLPDGNVLAAQAVRGDGAQNAFIIKMLFHYLLDGTTFGKKLPFWTDHLDPTQRLTVVGVVSEVWKQLHGHRAAIYRNAEPIKQGLFSVVAILDSNDPAKLLGDVRQLARFAGSAPLDLADKPANKDDVQTVKQLLADLEDDKFLVRQSASTRLEIIGEPVLPYLENVLDSKPPLELRRRAENIKARIIAAVEERRKGLFSDVSRRLQPSFIYIAKAEMLNGTPVDVLRIKLAEKDIPAGKHFQDQFGPDWNKVRVAVHGKQVVLLWGSDGALLSAALQNLKDGRRGLADAKAVAGFGKHADPARQIEFHASLPTLLGLMRADDLKQPKQLAGVASLTSLALTVEPERMQYDMRLSAADVKALVKEAAQPNGGQ